MIVSLALRVAEEYIGVAVPVEEVAS